MKKQVLIATGLAVLSTSAWATKARMEALGQNAGRGSFYIEDNRDIFRNAAHINQHKNYIVTEWGTANDAADSSAAPHAEGGFFREAGGSFAYGLYMGSELDTRNADRTLADAAYRSHDNALDAFFGGDAGVEWGLRLHYASGKNERGTPKREHSALGLGAGIVMGDLDFYANFRFSDESEGATNTNDKFEGDFMKFGVSYDWKMWTFFADYDVSGHEVTTAGAKAEDDTDTTITVGAGHTHEVSSTARIYTDVALQLTTEEDLNGSGAGTEDKTTSLPVTVGFEADATSWLTLRGSVSQNVILGSTDRETKPTAAPATDGKQTVANSTNVAAGATLNFGKLKVDGVIGTNADNPQTETGILSLDDAMARVSVHYWF